MSCGKPLRITEVREENGVCFHGGQSYAQNVFFQQNTVIRLLMSLGHKRQTFTLTDIWDVLLTTREYCLDVVRCELIIKDIDHKNRI